MEKTLYFIIIIVGSCFIPDHQIAASASTNNEFCSARSASIVTLKGSLSTPTTRGVSQSIEVFLNDKDLDILYLSNLGKIEISIINEQDLPIFNEIVSASKGAQSVIDLKNFPKGVYEIRFRNTKGNELSGLLNI